MKTNNTGTQEIVSKNTGQ